MNNGRVRKSLNTLIRAYKKKNRERNIYFTICRSERVSSIISLHFFNTWKISSG